MATDIRVIQSRPIGAADEQYDGINEVEKAKTNSDNNLEFLTKRGVILAITSVPNMLIAEARRKIKPPSVPTYYNTDKETHEENPNDPVYLNELQDWNFRVGSMGATAMLAFGTSIEFRPADVEGPEDKGWSDDIKEILDVDVPMQGRGRYAAWLRLYVLTDTELGDVMRAVSRASGVVTEQEVSEAEDTFRPDAEGDTAPGLPAS